MYFLLLSDLLRFSFSFAFENEPNNQLTSDHPAPVSSMQSLSSNLDSSSDTPILNATSWVKTSAPSLNWYSITSDSSGKRLAAVAQWDGIYTSNDYGVTWMKTKAPDLKWYSIASDSSGQRLAAVAYGGGIYTSNDYGTNWV